MGLLPAPRKPIISTSNPPCGGFVPAARGLPEQETKLFAKQGAHQLKGNDVLSFLGGILTF
jgi:hypothetical protein